MIAGYVIDFPIFDAPPPAAVGLACGTMVNHMNVGEAAGDPAKHVGLRFVDQIGARADPEAAEGVPAGATINFHASAHVKNRMAFENSFAVRIVIEHAATD